MADSKGAPRRLWLWLAFMRSPGADSDVDRDRAARSMVMGDNEVSRAWCRLVSGGNVDVTGQAELDGGDGGDGRGGSNEGTAR